MIASNDQNKSNQQAATNAQNTALAQNQAAQAQAQAAQKQALQDALGRFQSYNQQNPNPVNSLSPIQGPQQFGTGQTVGGGVVGSHGVQQAPQSGQQPQSGISPGLMQMLMQLMQQGGAARQTQPVARNTPTPADPNVAGSKSFSYSGANPGNATGYTAPGLYGNNPSYEQTPGAGYGYNGLSQDPSLAVGLDANGKPFTSEAAAQAYWTSLYNPDGSRKSLNNASPSASAPVLPQPWLKRMGGPQGGPQGAMGV
jgi:hypothetical protein